MSELKVTEISLDEYKRIAISYYYLWMNPKYFKFYKDYKILVCYRGKRLAGLWILPFVKEKKSLIVKRPYRLFPYCAPQLFENSNLKKRSVLVALVKYVFYYYDCLSIPMAPTLGLNIVFQMYGALVEWRHTHIVDRSWSLSAVSSRLSNHLRYAQKHFFIRDLSLNEFSFDRAIIESANTRRSRKEMAEEIFLNRDASILGVIDNNSKIVAAIFLAFDEFCAYLLHSWHIPEKRGAMIFLIAEAIQIAFNQKKVKTFDFEGSVLPSVDYFFSGFETKIIPYGYVHWHKDRNIMMKNVLKEIYDLERLVYL